MKRFGKCVGKRKYAYRTAALKQAELFARKYGATSVVYECPSCLDFHLTTKRRRKRRRA